MIEDLVLSIDQMNHLKELGVEVKDTALGWGWFHGLVNKQIKPVLLTEETKKTFESVGVVIYPTLTLQEVLELLPEEIDNGNMGKSLGFNKIVYMSRYGSGGNDYTFEGKNLLEAAYNALCWLTKYKYLNKK